MSLHGRPQPSPARASGSVPRSLPFVVLLLGCAQQVLCESDEEPQCAAGDLCEKVTATAHAGDAFLQNAMRHVAMATVSETDEQQSQQQHQQQLAVKAVEAEHARFLMQATFGPTRQGLAELKGLSYQEWIEKQLDLEVESHRAYYRSRVNPAYEDTKQSVAVRASPCNGGRFRDFAFSYRDVGDTISVDGSSAILVGGHVRTDLKQLPLATTWTGLAGFSGYICAVYEGVGKDVTLSEKKSCPRNERRVLPNPAIFKPKGAIEVHNPIIPVFDGVVLLGEGSGECKLKVPSDGSALFIKSFADYYVYDDRFQLVENTPTSPAYSTEGCVPRNRINEESCKIEVKPAEAVSSGLTAEVHVPVETSQYHTDTKESTLLGIIVDPVIDHPASSEAWSGFPTAARSIFTVRWTGQLTVDKAGEYSFYLTSDDGSRLTVDNQILIKNDGNHGMKTKKHTTTLEAGSHDILIQYFNSGWSGGIIWEWEGPDSKNKRELVPTSALSTSGVGLAPTTCPISCGSAGEVASNATLGHQLPMYLHSMGLDNDYDNRYANRLPSSLAKSTVWTMKAFEAKDQLRQRAAWALSQVFVVSTQGIGDDHFSEMWINYYDIFVRNAFGNFRDVLTEVTFNPLMGRYLTHSYSSSYAYNGNFPNENYAREIMQLFTIGLDKLNPDGSVQRDAHGVDIPTYTNDHILNFARVFTGFVEQPIRGNTEFRSGRNLIDPMAIVPRYHDCNPKPDLDGNYLGDGMPLCSDPLPAKTYLLKGSKYEWVVSASEALELDAGSELASAICGESCSAAYVTLAKTVSCSGKECETDTLDVVKIGDKYFKFVPPPCVHMAYPEPTQNVTPPFPPAAQAGWCTTDGRSSPRAYKLDSEDGDGPERRAQCLEKCRKAGGTGCRLIWSQGNKGCYVVLDMRPFSGNGRSRHLCWNFNSTGLAGYSYMLSKRHQAACPDGTEITSAAECQKAIEFLGLSLGSSPVWIHRESHKLPMGCSWNRYGRMYWSIKSTGQGHRDLHPVCRAHITVTVDGALMQMDGGTSFQATWLGEAPKPGVHPVGPITTQALRQAPQSEDQVLGKLKVGAYPPTKRCDVCEGDVKVYYGPTGAIGKDTVFEVGGKFFKNVESRLDFSGGLPAMRNPPVFLQRTSDPFALRQILAEVDSLLDHLFRHPNTPVFIAKRMIQRFVSSNPSPAYVEAVGTAFKTGTYDGVSYSGEYGDLAATVIAVLLHPEARILDTVGPTSARGALREPMVKIMHLLRAMEYKDEQRSHIVFRHLHDIIGQFPYNSPTVFNYYLADYELPMMKPEPEPEAEPEPEPEQEPEPEPEMEPEPEPEPEGPLVAPEFQIFTPPYFVGYLNSMSSLIKSGVSEGCEGKRLGISTYESNDGRGRTICPQGSLSWSGAGTPNATIEELDMLLTGGRLSPVAKEVVKVAYQKAPPGEELKAAQKAVVMTAEFNTLGAPLPLPGTRPPVPPQDGNSKRPYKAVIILFFAGGADTWNLVVPQQCKVYDEYRDIRTDLLLEPSEVTGITTVGQQCKKFGIHNSLPFLKELYDKRQAAFVTNVGNLVEPMTVQSFRSGGARKCFNLFSHSDQQNGAQTLKCQDAGTGAMGTGGRIADALAQGSKQFTTTSFSMAGSAAWSVGFLTRREILDSSGTTGMDDYEEWIGAVSNITAQRHGNVYAEAYSDAFQRSLEVTEELGRYLDEAKLMTNYRTSGRLSKQLYQVAKLISAREGRQAERDFFFVSTGGWDMHSNMKMNLARNFGEINEALKDFVAEMEAQGVWDSVLLATESEFARTLDSNGGGSDHAWAGQHFMVSGAINGGRIYNKYPASMAAGNPQDLGRGRLVPEYPWESIMVPIAEWLGVETDQKQETFPNIGFFNSTHIIPERVLFKRR